MISSLLHLVGLRPRVYYTLTNFRGGGKAPLAPPSIRQCFVSDICLQDVLKTTEPFHPVCINNGHECRNLILEISCVCFGDTLSSLYNWISFLTSLGTYRPIMDFDVDPVYMKDVDVNSIEGNIILKTCYTLFGSVHKQ